jgi:hypothetical protein
MVRATALGHAIMQRKSATVRATAIRHAAVYRAQSAAVRATAMRHAIMQRKSATVRASTIMHALMYGEQSVTVRATALMHVMSCRCRWESTAVMVTLLATATTPRATQPRLTKLGTVNAIARKLILVESRRAASDWCGIVTVRKHRVVC